MKRGITIILTLAMLFSLSSVAFAAEPMTETREIIVSQAVDGDDRVSVEYTVHYVP